MAMVRPSDPTVLKRIYCLVDPRTALLRYVGITTKTLHKRLVEHCKYSRNAAKQAHRDRWIRQLLDANLRPVILLIEETFDNERECFWISHYRTAGLNLVNRTDGGEGVHGILRDEEVRKRMSEARRGKKLSEEHRQNIGKGLLGHKHSADSIAKMSAAWHARTDHEEIRARILERNRTQDPSKWITPEYRQKMREIKTGFRHTEESKKKMSEKQRGKKMPPLTAEQRAKKSAAQTGKKFPPERCQRMSEQRKGKPKPPAEAERLRTLNVGRKFGPLSEEHKQKLRDAHARRRAEKLQEQGLTGTEG